VLVSTARGRTTDLGNRLGGDEGRRPAPQLEFQRKLYGDQTKRCMRKPFCLARPPRAQRGDAGRAQSGACMNWRWGSPAAPDDAGQQALVDNTAECRAAVWGLCATDWNDVAFRRGRMVLLCQPKNCWEENVGRLRHVAKIGLA